MGEHSLMCYTQEEVERAIHRSRMKYQTDMQSNLATAEDNGRQMGRAEGRTERSFEIARAALEMKMEIADIIKLTGLTYEEIEALGKGS